MSATGGKGKKGRGKRQAQSAALNAKYRHEAARLKKLGILSKRVNARKNISRSTRTKINKFRDVLEGRAIAVPAPKPVRRKYTEREVLEERGRFLIAPKQYENQRGRLKRGLVQIVRPLKNGQEEYVILPFRPADMPELVRKLKTDESLDNLKEPDEYFSFRLEGHNSQLAFPDAREMGDYIEVFYQHLFKPDVTQRAFKFFTFQRFRTNKALIEGRTPFESHEPKVPYNTNARSTDRESSWMRQAKLKRLAARKRKQREQETPEERKTRLAKQRIRSAQNRQRKFDEDK